MNIKKAVQQQFSKSAESYVHSPIHKDGKDLNKLLEIATISGDELLLDVATGGGHTANAFAPHVKKVTALDLTREMLDSAQTFIKNNGNENVEYIEGDAEHLPFSNDVFDLVTCRIAPHHFPNVQQFVSEVQRVLKQNGQLLLIDNVVPEDNELDQFYNYIEKTRDYSHFRAWKKSEWIQMLELSGFEIVEWHRFVKTFQFDTWCNRMNLPEEEKVALNNFIVSASEKIKTKFKIVIENNQVISFQGEAIIVKAVAN